MAFFCINCKSNIEPKFKACPFCGEPITDFLRRYMEEPIDGKYQIMSRLGVGGMGEVYKVLHIHLNSLRVVKLMRPTIAAEESAHERFVREARLATRIHHPNVATLFDFSTLGDGSYYMVWEYIEGTNLMEVIRPRGCLPPKHAATLAVQALLGLDAIHKVGIVHRDISPENMMILRDDYGEESVKIIDLGIAKQWGEQTDDKTKTGMFVGKWKYCSPEHLGMLKEGERIDGRADLYSFGIVMYEMLTGVPPFVADTPHRYLLLHATETPKPFKELNPATTVSPELEAVVFKALEKDRNKRYATAREFAKALEALIPSLSEVAPVIPATEYRDEPTAERAVGDSSTIARPAQKKKSVTEEAPLPSAEEERAAYDRLTQQSALPKLKQDQVATVVNQEMIGTVASVEQPKLGRADVTVANREMERTPVEVGEQPKQRPWWLVAAAAAILVGILVAVPMLNNTPDEPLTTTSATRSSILPNVPSGAAASQVASAEPAKIGLNAFPWGEIIYIKNLETGKAVEFNERLVTPQSIQLPAGRYELVMMNPKYPKQLTQTIDVRAGETRMVMFEFSNTADAEYPDFGGELR